MNYIKQIYRQVGGSIAASSPQSLCAKPQDNKTPIVNTPTVKEGGDIVMKENTLQP